VPVIAEQVGGDPIGHPERPGQERSIRLLDEDQAAGHERRRGIQPAPLAVQSGGAGTQFQGQAGARPAARDVVVEVRVEALEANVEIGREGHEEHFEIGVVKFEGPREAAQPEPGTGGLGEIRAGFYPRDGRGELGQGARVQPGGPGQELINLGI
jgi:hypothetical protein